MNLAAKSLITLLALPALLLPAASLTYILWQGMPALDLEFLFSHGEEAQFGASRGILPQLIGSLLLALGACLVAAPFALATALFHQLYASSLQRRLLDQLLQVLQGIPPIVFGLCGLIILVHLFQWGVSLASGALVLAVVILPMLVLNNIATLQRIAPEYSEAGRALGLSDGFLVWRVWLPQARLGMLTGLMLAIARALSETAPILFTATVFSGVVWPSSIFSPVTTLQTHIFYLAQEGGSSAAIEVAWGSASVLVLVVALFGLLARWLRQLGTQS